MVMVYPMEDAETLLSSFHFTVFINFFFFVNFLLSFLVLALLKSVHTLLLKSSQPFIALTTKAKSYNNQSKLHDQTLLEHHHFHFILCEIKSLLFFLLCSSGARWPPLSANGTYHLA